MVSFLLLVFGFFHLPVFRSDVMTRYFSYVKWYKQACVDKCNSLTNPNSQTGQICQYKDHKEHYVNENTPYTECYCTCLTSCEFSVISEMLTECAVNRLTTIKDKVASEIGLAVVKAATSAVPVVSPLVKSFWTIIDPALGTGPSSLINQVTADVNQAFDQLKDCMHISDSEYKVEATLDAWNGIFNAYQNLVGTEGNLYEFKLLYTFSEFNTHIATIFGIPENNVIEYEGILAIYTALYPEYITLAYDWLIYLRNDKKDKANFLNELIATWQSFDILKKWVEWARIAISDDLEDRTQKRPCYNAAHLINNDLQSWNQDFNERNLAPLEALIEELYYLDGMVYLTSLGNEWNCNQPDHCCIAGWRSGCGQGCHKSHCAKAHSYDHRYAWVPLDYSRNPYKCCMVEHIHLPLNDIECDVLETSITLADNKQLSENVKITKYFEIEMDITINSYISNPQNNWGDDAAGGILQIGVPSDMGKRYPILSIFNYNGINYFDVRLTENAGGCCGVSLKNKIENFELGDHHIYAVATPTSFCVEWDYFHVWCTTEWNGDRIIPSNVEYPVYMGPGRAAAATVSNLCIRASTAGLYEDQCPTVTCPVVGSSCGYTTDRSSAQCQCASGFVFTDDGEKCRAHSYLTSTSYITGNGVPNQAGWQLFEGAGKWYECQNGYVIGGFYKHQCQNLNCLEWMKCIKPDVDITVNNNDCYDKDIGASFDSAGTQTCDEGYFVRGIWSNTNNDGSCSGYGLSCWEKLRCCKYDENVLVYGSLEYPQDWGTCFDGTSIEWCVTPPHLFITGFKRSGSLKDAQLFRLEGATVRILYLTYEASNSINVTVDNKIPGVPWKYVIFFGIVGAFIIIWNIYMWYIYFYGDSKQNRSKNDRYYFSDNDL